MEPKKEKEDLEMTEGEEEETKKVSQEEFDQICSEGADFWLTISHGSIHEDSVKIGNTHSLEGTKKYLDHLKKILWNTCGISIDVILPEIPKIITVWPKSGEMELYEG